MAIRLEGLFWERSVSVPDSRVVSFDIEGALVHHVVMIIMIMSSCHIKLLLSFFFVGRH